MRKTLILFLAIILIYPFTIYAYSDHDNGKKENYDEQELSNESINKTLNIKDNYYLEEYFSTEELKSVISSNTDVAEVKDNELILHKVGKTDIVFEDDSNYKVLHLTVTKDALDSNPKTTGTTVFAIILGVVLILSLITLNRKTDY